MCLLAADRLFASKLQVLHHLQVAQYYLDVLEGSDGVMMAPPPRAKRQGRRQDDGLESDAAGSDVEHDTKDEPPAKRRPRRERRLHEGSVKADNEEVSEDEGLGDSDFDAGQSAHNPDPEVFPLEARHGVF